MKENFLVGLDLTVPVLSCTVWLRSLTAEMIMTLTFNVVLFMYFLVLPIAGIYDALLTQKFSVADPTAKGPYLRLASRKKWLSGIVSIFFLAWWLYSLSPQAHVQFFRLMMSASTALTAIIAGWQQDMLKAIPDRPVEERSC